MIFFLIGAVLLAAIGLLVFQMSASMDARRDRREMTAAELDARVENAVRQAVEPLSERIATLEARLENAPPASAEEPVRAAPGSRRDRA